MRFEAKNQQHKKAAKMGNFGDVSQTVARWWSYRSHLRLIRKRSAPTDQVNSEEMQKRQRYVRHPHMEAGMWGQIERGRARYIACVVEQCDTYISVHAFKASEILCAPATDDPYVEVASLSAQVPLSWVPLTDPRIVIVRLLMCMFDGKVRFVGQP